MARTIVVKVGNKQKTDSVKNLEFNQTFEIWGKRFMKIAKRTSRLVTNGVVWFTNEFGMRDWRYDHKVQIDFWVYDLDNHKLVSMVEYTQVIPGPIIKVVD